MNGAVVYRGPSLLTGDPIVVALTGFAQPSANFKTGPMIQAWVLRADQKPTEAVESGADTAICGNCKHRSGSNVGRSCYVIWWLGPQNVYRALASYPSLTPGELAPLLKQHQVRLTAYGDPAAAPASLWTDLARVSGGWTGYTHFWRTCDQQLRLVLMASVDSEAEKGEAAGKGWRTFRCRSASEPLLRDEVICPASAEGGHATTCHDCELCSGLHKNAKSIAIYAHGTRIKWFSNEGGDDAHTRRTQAPVGYYGADHGPRDVEHLSGVRRLLAGSDAHDRVDSPHATVSGLFTPRADERRAVVSPATATQPAAIPIGEQCVLCGCRLTTKYFIELGLCGSCSERPEAKRLPRNANGRVVRSVPAAPVAPKPLAGFTPRQTRAFTPADKSLIKAMQHAVPAGDLLRILNDRLAADRVDLAPYTMEQLTAELQTLIEPSATDWAWLRFHLRKAKQSGVLASITPAMVEDFAVVYSLNPAQLLHINDILASAKEDQ